MRLDSKDVLFSFVQKYIRDNVNTVSIGKVVGRSQFQDTQSVDINLQVSRLYKNGDVLPYTNQVLYNIPVVFPSGGGGGMTFPIAIGDNVLVVFAQRNIEPWLLSDGDSEMIPSCSRHYSEDDAIAIPCIFTSKNNLSPDPDNFKLFFKESSLEITPSNKITLLNSNGVAIMDEDGSFSYSTGSVNISYNNSGNITVENAQGTFELSTSGAFSMENSSGHIRLSSAGVVNINGVVISASGDLTVTGATALSATVTSAGHDIGSGHKHLSVQSGSDLSGVPQ